MAATADTLRPAIDRGTEAGPWGFHLLLDLGGCRIEAVRSADTIRSFTRALVDAIDMQAHGEPLLAHFAEHKADAAGWSLVQLIETSSITGHFCDLTGDAYIDVFSCKWFDPDCAVRVVKECFAPGRISRSFVERQA
ncbi:MAG: S-adenosylmethionine decarboxylase family protein [Gaiella sp.]